MERLGSSGSLGTGEIPICPSGSDEQGVYGKRGFTQPILDGLDDEDRREEDLWSPAPAPASEFGEKKRRLGVDQVKALEKNFEVENKLEPERKVKLAQELGLQPRQVAVWFQNRRARWKTKQLERDYGLLKADYDALKLDFDALHLDKETLLAEIKELRAKLADEGSFCSIKEEPVVSQNDKNGKEIAGEEEEDPPAVIYKDGSSGSSDSDSSAILNDENSPNHLGVSSSSSPAILSDQHHPNLYHHRHHQHHHFQQSIGMGFDQYFSSYSPPQIQSSDGRLKGASWYYQQNQQQLWKMEEHNFLGGDDPCPSNFFSDDQAPNFSWYCSDQWELK